jgi:hydroxycarboxylate dehydrogenase B
MVPGDPERRAREHRTANGLPLTTETWNSILDAGAALGLQPDELAAMADPKILETE